MTREKQTSIGSLGLIACVIMGIGVLNFLMKLLRGERRDDNDEWVSYDRMIAPRYLSLQSD